jgi:hypothetical protein
MSEQIKYPILGQEAVVGRDGLGRVTEIGPADRCGSGNPEWIGVTPYAGRTWQINFAPHNVRLIPIEDTQCGELRAENDRLRIDNAVLRSEAVDFIAAVGLATTAVPTMQINVRDPIGMMQRVVAEVQKLRATNERLREALADMLAGWRYLRDMYGDLSGVGWDRAEAKAQEALEDGR